MAKPIDILLDDNFDLMAKDGDFVLGDASLQNQQLILLSHKGEFKETPLLGIGLSNYLLDDSTIHEMHQEIQKQFSIDGMNVIEISGNTWESTNINAEYV
ncbi:MAG: oxidase [Bacteroidota bacterium]